MNLLLGLVKWIYGKQNLNDPSVMAAINKGFKFCIDRGGTFTDVYAICPNGEVKVIKLLSIDKENLDASREGIRRIIEDYTNTKLDKNCIIDPSLIEYVRIGTTIGTNALLERQGENFALVITKGFHDLLQIGHQSRPNIFDLKITRPDILYSEIVEADERIILQNSQCSVADFQNLPVKNTHTGENVLILKELDEEKIKKDLRLILAKGIKNLAIALIHSYIYPNHEQKIKRIAQQMGFKQISLSSEIMPMVKIVERGQTACVDAYLSPHIQKYAANFGSGFKNKFENLNVLFMQSDGGLVPVKQFSGARSILSGPAGGVLGVAGVSSELNSVPIIGFDMGGTSTDVCRYHGSFDHTYESTTAGISIRTPQLDITTVAAGGGSRLFYRSGLFTVGPESAGAYPGPICYRNNGYLTITDANLCLGRLQPLYFPKIFGETRDQPLDKQSVIQKFRELTKEIKNDYAEMTIEEVALGFIKVANETMCRPIRAITEGKGFNPSDHVLCCFGGAGAQHACEVARFLSIKTVFIHKYASILSAYGMSLADIVYEEQEPASYVYEKSIFKSINQRFCSLKKRCYEKFCEQRLETFEIKYEYYLNLRYEGTDFPFMCKSDNIIDSSENTNYCELTDYENVFCKRYKTEFGFTMKRAIIVDDIRVRASAKFRDDHLQNIPKRTNELKPNDLVDCYFQYRGYVKTQLYLLKDLAAEDIINGPAIIIDENSTILIEPNCQALITEFGNIKIFVEPENYKNFESLNPTLLSMFSHRFMSIAEQMGRALQRTAISINIKERLDFSCAIFDNKGNLVCNAPHIPVHLGAMQEAIKFQLENTVICEGDVILSNHPKAGGSHLPDLTVITPVFWQRKIIFFVANRGHHAEIGGITPGSMPSNSTSLSQEGVMFISFKIVENGVFQEDKLIEKFTKPENGYGTRKISDNIGDLKSQIGANYRGVCLIFDLCKTYGLEMVLEYMNHIQEVTSRCITNLLKNVYNKQSKLEAIDFMDDGTPIKLVINISPEGKAIFDFTGTGLQTYNNTNTPKAICLSAIIYCLKCMIKEAIPLNNGCLEPITTIIEKGSLLDPDEDSAVVGGNVCTSQRIVDVILKSFNVCAASCGCMNNITFGDENFGYYETIGGGSGAGPDWNGVSGVHTHMTNTRITDVEIVERKHPVMVKTFILRKGSGGTGRFNGGDGLIREILFRKNIACSVLSERRVFAPYGMQGGCDGKKGLNLLFYANGKKVNLGSKAFFNAQPGDIFHIETPGGGGYGR